MAEWLPIDTAPKDGRRILVRCRLIGPCVASAGWDNDSPNDIRWGVVNDVYAEPTHWMPLPDPPKKSPD